MERRGEAGGGEPEAAPRPAAARDAALPFEEQPDHEDAEGQRESEVEVLRLREGGFLRALQVGPGDVVRQPEPLVPEPGEDPCHLCFVCRGAPRSVPLRPPASPAAAAGGEKRMRARVSPADAAAERRCRLPAPTARRG